MPDKQSLVPAERIERAILLIRGQKVMLDADLAHLYGVTTKALNQVVKRNPDRFPADFMFRLTKQEKEEVVTNCDHLQKLKFSPVLPFQIGASNLKSQIAISRRTPPTATSSLSLLTFHLSRLTPHAPLRCQTIDTEPQSR